MGTDRHGIAMRPSVTPLIPSQKTIWPSSATPWGSIQQRLDAAGEVFLDELEAGQP
jgi:hypothetical protein